MRDRIPVDLEELRRLYLEDGLTLRQVGAKVGASASTVQMRLEEAGIRRSRVDKARERRETAIAVRLYHEEGLSVLAAAKAANIPPSTLRTRLVGYGRPLRPPSAERISGVNLALFRRLNGSMSAPRIAERLGICVGTLRDRCAKAGLRILRRNEIDPNLIPYLASLHFEDGLPPGTIARRLGLGRGAVRSALERAGKPLLSKEEMSVRRGKPLSRRPGAGGRKPGSRGRKFLGLP